MCTGSKAYLDAWLSEVASLALPGLCKKELAWHRLIRSDIEAVKTDRALAEGSVEHTVNISNKLRRFH